MLEPDIIQVLFGLVIAGLSWWMTTTWRSVQELKNNLRGMELDIAKNYRTKEETDKIHDRIFENLSAKLDKIGDLELAIAQNDVSRANMINQLNGIEKRLEIIYEELRNAKS
jgi:chromosome segregation ATPase